MSEYIEREAAIAVVQGGIEFEEETKGNGVRTLVIVQKGIKRLPAADVAPIVHASWDLCKDDDERPRCSACDHIALHDSESYHLTPGCPYCFAHMDAQEADHA
jgi:hypothetical protein